MSRPVVVASLLALSCARAPVPLEVRLAQAPPMPADATREVAACATDGLACQMAATMAPLDTLQKACLDEVSGACVAFTVAQLERPALLAEWKPLVEQLQQSCVRGDPSACGLAKRYERSELLEYFTLFEPMGRPPGNPRRFQLVVDDDSNLKSLREDACQASEPLSCDPPLAKRWNEYSREDLALDAQCEAGHLAACAQLAREGDEELRAKHPSADEAMKKACESGLSVFCGELSPSEAVPEAWLEAKQRDARARCVAGTSAMACEVLRGTNVDPPLCEGIHKACEQFACPVGLAARLVECGRKVAPWPEEDAVAARATLAVVEVSCREGVAEACAAVASRYAKGGGVPQDPRSALAYAELACRVHGHAPSCELEKSLRPLPTVAAAPAEHPRRVVITPPFTQKDATMSAATREALLVSLQGAVAKFGATHAFEIVPMVEVLAARRWAGQAEPCVLDCVRTLERRFHPIAVLVPVFSGKHGVHLAEVKLHRLEPVGRSSSFGDGDETEAGLLKRFGERVAQRLTECERAFAPKPPDLPKWTGPAPRLAAAIEAGRLLGGARTLLEAANNATWESSTTDREHWLEHVTARLAVPRGNRYALFLDLLAPVEDRSFALLPERVSRLGGIGVDSQAFPSAAITREVALAKCPVTRGIVGHRGRSEESSDEEGWRPRGDPEPPAPPELEGASNTDFLFLVAANLDADDELDCWTLASYDRPGGEGERWIGRAEAFHEHADVPEKDVEDAFAARDALVGVSVWASMLGSRTRAFPESYAPVADALAHTGKALDLKAACDTFTYERRAPNVLRLACAAIGFDQEIHADWKDGALVMEVAGHRTAIEAASVKMALERLEAKAP